MSDSGQQPQKIQPAAAAEKATRRVAASTGSAAPVAKAAGKPATAKAAAPTKPAVKVTVPVTAVRAIPPIAPVMLEVSDLPAPAGVTESAATPKAVEIVKERSTADAASGAAIVPATASSEKALGLGLDPSQVLSEVLAERQDLLVRRLQKMGIQRGHVLFDGQWMSPADARAVYRRMQVRSWMSIVEAVLLLGAMVLSAGVIGVLLAVFAGLRAG